MLPLFPWKSDIFINFVYTQLSLFLLFCLDKLYSIWTCSLCASKNNCLFCSNPGHPFCSGVTLAKLAAVTMDEQGNETFDTSGALDKLRKVSLVFCSCGPFQECIICGSQFQIPLCIIFSIVLMSIWTKPPNKRSKATLSSTEKTKNQQQHFAHNKRPIKMNRTMGNIPKCLDKDVQPL